MATSTLPDVGRKAAVRPLVLDIALGLGVAATYVVFALALYHRIDFYNLCISVDSWLDGDQHRVVRTLTARDDPWHYRSSVHPLWPLISLPFIGLMKVTHDLKLLLNLFIAFQAAALGAVLFTALRTLAGRLDSALGCALFLSSAAAWFWLPVPETYVLGAVSILIPFLWLTLPRGAHDEATGVLQSTISLSVTTTNWIAGLGAALLALGWRRAAMTSLAALGLLAGLHVIQARGFPQAGAFLDFWSDLPHSIGGFDTVDRGPFLDHVKTFFLNALAAPHPVVFAVDDESAAGILSRMQPAPVALSPAALGVYAVWGVLVGLGVWGHVKNRFADKRLTLTLMVLAFLFALHSVYGVETFLYSMHFVPMFAILAVAGLQGGPRVLLRGVMVVGIGLGMIHNWDAFGWVTAWFNALPLTPIGFNGVGAEICLVR